MTMPQPQRLMQNSHLLHENQFGENSLEAKVTPCFKNSHLETGHFKYPIFTSLDFKNLDYAYITALPEYIVPKISNPTYKVEKVSMKYF